MKKNPVIAALSLSLLRRWSFFQDMTDEDLMTVKSVYVFHVNSHVGCRGGPAAIILTTDDRVFGLGHNCAHVNILGFSIDGPGYKLEETSLPLEVAALSGKRIKMMSVGELVGAAITKKGSLYWWGHCCRKVGEIKTPHVPKSGKYINVSCGQRMMAALSESGKVYVWGQVISNGWFLEGQRVYLDERISHISCGQHHLAMLGKKGTVFTWGRGDEGQRGLPVYSFSDLYTAKRIPTEPCDQVVCGPYSTFCVTVSREVKACGMNCDGHLGTEDLSKRVKTLSRVPIKEAVANLAVLRMASNHCRITAASADGEIYVWGETTHPVPNQALSFFDVFTSLEVTSTLITVNTPDIINGWAMSNVITPRELKSATSAEVLAFAYFHDRPESSVGSRTLTAPHNAYLSSQITCPDSGKNFIMNKFFKDVCSPNFTFKHVHRKNWFL